MFLSKRGRIYYLVFKDPSERRKRISTGASTKSEALRFLQSFNEKEHARRRAIEDITLSQFLPTLIDYTRSIHTPNTVRAHHTAMNELIRFLSADRVMRTITTAECERFLAEKTVRASPWTARKYRLALGAIFEQAKRWGHILENPWRSVKKRKMPELLPVYFTREQIRDLLAVIEDRDFRELVIVAVLTGLRQGELLAMRWDWVDLGRRTITVRNTESFTTKSKRVRVVPLCDDALTILLSRQDRRDPNSPVVFTRKGRPILPDYATHRLKRYIMKAGLPRELHFHSLRHGYASWLVQGGVSLVQVGRLLGHSSTQVTEIYAHLVPSDMHCVLGPLHLNN